MGYGGGGGRMQQEAGRQVALLFPGTSSYLGHLLEGAHNPHTHAQRSVS